MNKNVRVLYKKTGEIPQIKYITDMLPIKKLIVNGNLELSKFENCIIVCNNRKKNKNKLPNIVLDFKHISGDFFLIGYDIKEKDFRSLDIDEAMFYIDSLQRKSFQYDKYQNWLTKSKKSTANDFQYQKFQKDLEQKLNSENETSKKSNSSPYSEKMLEMILNIQAIILKYIKNMNGEQ